MNQLLSTGYESNEKEILRDYVVSSVGRVINIEKKIYKKSSIAAQWMGIALEAIRKELPYPTIITRKLHLLSSSMHDACAAFDPEMIGAYRSLKGKKIRNITESDEFIRAAAIAAAAHKSLIILFPNHRKFFDQCLVSQGFSDRYHSALYLGRKAAKSVIRARKNDGSNSLNNYEDTSEYEYTKTANDINSWKPLKIPTGFILDENGIPEVTDDPDSFKIQKPVTPHWGNVKPFVISSGKHFRPAPPPKFGDKSNYVDALGNISTGDNAFRKQFSEVLDVNGSLTPIQKFTAEYWADGPQSTSPPGHWNEIALDLCVRSANTLADDIKLFHSLNAAMFDVGISIWDAKYKYNYVRPQSAIRDLFKDDIIIGWAGPNQGVKLIPGNQWRPYQDVNFVTPAFPEYPSGHSGFSYAAATILEGFFGSDKYYDGINRGAHDLNADGNRDLIGTYVASKMSFEEYEGDPMILQWNTLWDAAADAGLSRIYGGIHIQDSDLRGREIGSQVGMLVSEQLL